MFYVTVSALRVVVAAKHQWLASPLTGIQLPGSVRIVQVSAGYEHALLLSANGQMLKRDFSLLQ